MSGGCGCGGGKTPKQVKRPSTPKVAAQGGYKQWNGPTQKGG